MVCATDAGREGELIFRLVYEYAGCNKPMERLWISSMEDAAIREGLDHLRPGSDYDKLYDAAVCRAGADWLIGINATRLFSVLYGVTLNVGRVMSPTLALLVQRESDIESFISKPFYVPEITCGGFTASGEKMTERSEAEKIRMDCDHNSAFVRSVEKQVKTIQPPRLYDLTTLQRECNRIYGYTAQQTLDYVQSLYEKKLATYPRTDSQYLTKDMQATAASLILWLRDNMTFGKGYAGEPDIDRVTDDSKVTDHHAIIPTEIPPSSTLSKEEKLIYDLVARRFIAVFYPECKISNTLVEGKVGKIFFKANGKQILELGWREIYVKDKKDDSEKKDKEEEQLIPEFKVGEKGEHSPLIHQGKTSPPKPYTEATLLRAMETAGKQVDDEELRELMKSSGIGRPSTRANIIETLFKRKYIERKKKNLMATTTGVELIDTIEDELLKSPELTGEWEFKLRKIEKGEYEASQFKDELIQMVTDLTRKVISEKAKIISFQNEVKELPKKEKVARKAVTIQWEEEQCPQCKSSRLVKGKTAIGCSNFKNCDFKIPFVIFGKKITEKQILDSILKGKTTKLKGFTEHPNQLTEGILSLTENAGFELNA